MDEKDDKLLRRPGESVRQSGKGLMGFIPKKDGKMSDLLGENMALYTFLTRSKDIKPAAEQEAKADCCTCCKQVKPVFFVGKYLQQCRLCGHMYCMRCASMIFLPARFCHGGQQDGRALICYGCEIRTRFQAEVEIGPFIQSPKPPAPQTIDGLLIGLPHWVNAALFRRCAKCHERSRQGHNCRFCGDLFCDKCTVKQPVPSSFEKKGKLGTSRVCDRCKFLVSAGAKLKIEDRSGEGKDPPELAAMKHELSQQFLNKLQRVACAGCESAFHLLNKRYQCPFCANSWCANCIEPHLVKEKMAQAGHASRRDNNRGARKQSNFSSQFLAGTVMNSTKLNPQVMALEKLARMSEEHRNKRFAKNPRGPASPRAAAAASPAEKDPLTSSTSNAEVVLGEVQASFDILCQLGEGSYGTVYKALDKTTDKLVAIKVIEDQSDQQKLAELMEEIKFMEECANDHVVAYRGTYLSEGRTCITMEYCCAGSLTDIMEVTDKTFEEREIAILMREALMGLEFLHKNNKIHRDIKAGNLLLNELGECKLADFGVSCRLTPGTRRMTVIGSPYWMAPEILQAKDKKGYDEKVDIWSLGITAMELAKGVPPLSDMHPMRAIFKIPIAQPPTLPDPEMWSKEFVDFLTHCLRKDPATRAPASELLRHPFIASAGSISIIQELVTRVMADMDQFRVREVVAQQAEAKKVDAIVEDPAEEEAATSSGTTQYGTTELSSESLAVDSYKLDFEKAQSYGPPASGTMLLSTDDISDDSYLLQAPAKSIATTAAYPQPASPTNVHPPASPAQAPPVPASPSAGKGQACKAYTDVAEVQFRQCCQVRDRTHLLKTYPRCFVGKQTVDALVATGVCSSRAAAVELGKSLMLAGVFFHVSQEHHFKDEELFYRFTSDFALLK